MLPLHLARALAWLAAMYCMAAHADPILTPPQAGRLALSRHADGTPSLALTAELAAPMPISIAGPRALADTGTLETGTPKLTLARVGLISQNQSLALIVRLDSSEAARVDKDQAENLPLATASRFIDDAALWWMPRVWAGVVVGRAMVPFSRFRQIDDLTLTSGLAPRSIARLTPERRWGATFLGDLGAVAYAAGAYADLDDLELRAPDDPSAGGRAMAMIHIGWTPRAPIGADFMATPRSDPWFDTGRFAAGLGVLWRYGSAGHRYDVSLSGQIKHRHLATMGELIARVDNGALRLSGAAEASAVIGDRAALILLLELDGDDGTSRWSGGGGASWLVTGDRRTRVSALGWIDRAAGEDDIGHAVLVAVQGAL